MRRIETALSREANKRVVGQGSRERHVEDEVTSGKRRTRAGSNDKADGRRQWEIVEPEFGQQLQRRNGSERQEGKNRGGEHPQDIEREHEKPSTAEREEQKGGICRGG